jgi:hypothetical protein
MPIRQLFSFFRKLRERRDEGLWREWEALLTDLRQKGGWIGEVAGILQNARTGTKAYVRRLGMRDVEAVWAPNRRLTPRTFIHATSVSKRQGTAGSHHAEEFWWVNRVGRIASREAYVGWLRHNERLAQGVKAEGAQRGPAFSGG